MNLAKFCAFVATIFVLLPTAHAKLDKPFFYKMEKNGMVSFILGTYHVGVSLDELPKPVLEQIAKSKTILTEFKPDEAVVATLLFAPAFEFPTGDFDTMGGLPEPTIRRLVGRGIPEDVAKRMADDACFGMMYSHFYFPKMITLDFQLYNQAFLNNVEIEALDTPDIRERALRAAQKREPSSVCSLIGILNQYSDRQIDEIVDHSLNDYRSGDEAIVDKNAPDIETQFRTAAWIPEIIQKTADGNKLIAVGYGHLLGPAGLLNLLKIQGYKITRYPF